MINRELASPPQTSLPLTPAAPRSTASPSPSPTLSPRAPRALARETLLLSALIALFAGGCSQYETFDSSEHLKTIYGERVGDSQAADIEVPFALDDEVLAAFDARYKPVPNEFRRIDHVNDFIFHYLDLTYALNPTRNAVETFRAQRGNCLSFVNLFVGIARHHRLNPFYVEVTDLQRWSYSQGTVISRGHIVAGIYVGGELKTYDFLPYRSKSYRDFQPIDDLTAAAHFFNNLGAEALLRGDMEDARKHVETAQRIKPDFVKSINNLGVLYSRDGDLDRAVATYERGLAIDPEHPALLTNLARAKQQLGRLGEAQELMSRLEGVNSGNPYFYVYRGELALSQGNLAEALEYMKTALKRDSEVPEVHLGLLKVYLEMGEMGKVKHHLARALRLDATHPEGRKYAAMLQAMTDGGEPGGVPAAGLGEGDDSERPRP